MSEATQSIEKDIKVMLDAIRTAAQEGWFYDEWEVRDQQRELDKMKARLKDEQKKEAMK